MDKHDEERQIRVSLETLARHVSENWREQLTALRAALDQQISSMEETLDSGDHNPIINATVKHVSRAAAERADHARKQAEATAAQALAAIEVELRARLAAETSANTMLRTALDEAKRELESARTSTAKVEAASKAAAAQHRDALNDQKKLTAALDRAQAQLADLQGRVKSIQREADTAGASLAAAEQQVQGLTAERDDLLQRMKTVTTAKTAAEAQYRQLEAVNQKLSQALSQMLRERQPDSVPPTSAAPPRAKETARQAPASAAAPRGGPSAVVPAPGPAGPQKKPLQFSERARDAKRVKIRRGIDVTVDGIPGELVDLSVGGAQAVLRQAVKVNQLVRLMLLTPAGQVICKGRIVWVVPEQPETSLSVYRTGVKFTDADAEGVENFMNDFREQHPVQSRHSSGVA
jgi:hypothetical protein